VEQKVVRYRQTSYFISYNNMESKKMVKIMVREEARTNGHEENRLNTPRLTPPQTYPR